MTSSPALPPLLLPSRPPATAGIVPPGWVCVVRCPVWVDLGARQSVTLEPWHEGLTPRELVPASWELGAAILVGGRLLEAERYDDPTALAPGDTVHIAATPGDPIDFLIQVAIAAAVSLAAGFIVRALIGKPEGPQRPGDNSSQTYSWSGIRTAYEARGLPIPMPFGGVRTGGIAIQSWVDNLNAGNQTRSILNILILLGGPGPVQSIGGITVDSDFLTGEDLPEGMQINGNSAVNYQGVTVFLRLGTLEQEPIPGCNQIRRTSLVDLLIDQITKNENDGGEPLQTNWELAAGWDFGAGEEYQAAIVQLFFPQGLYVVQSDGTVITEEVELQIRYVELDSGGTPTGPFVTLQPFKIDKLIQGAFGVDIPVQFFDPATYVPGSSGSALSLDGDDTYLSIPGTFTSASIATGGTWTNGTEPDEFSIELWVQIDEIRKQVLAAWLDGVALASGKDGDLQFSHVVPGPSTVGDPVTGFMIRTINQSGQTGLMATIGQGTVSPILGGTAAVAGIDYDTIAEKNNGNSRVLVGGGFHHIVFTYKRNASGTQNRLRFYVDGTMIEEKLTPVNMIFPSTAFMLAEGSPWVSTDRSAHATYDQTVLHARELQDNEILNRYNGGLGLDETNVVTPVAVWKFDAIVAGAPDKIADETANNHDLNIVTDGGEALVPGHIVLAAAAGTLVAKRYRVQVQRLDPVRGEDAPNIADEVRFQTIIGVLYEELAYPEMALAFVQIEATEQLNTTRPDVTFVGEWLAGKVWDGVDSESPTFVDQWTKNPAWVCSRVLLERVNGLGHVFEPKDIDVVSLQELADWCADGVADRLGQLEVLTIQYVNVSGEDRLRFVFPTGVTPLAHWEVGYQLRLEVTDSSAAPAWFAQLLAAQPFTIIAVKFSQQESIDCAWPTSIPPNPSPNTYFANALGDVIDVQGSHARHEFDGVLEERDKDAWDVVLAILRACRSYPVRVGRRIRFKSNRARPVSFVFSNDNIRRGTFRLSIGGSPEARFSRATMEILRQENDFRRGPVTVTHPDATNGTFGIAPITRVFSYIGITRKTHAARELTFLLRAANALQMVAEWGSFTDSMLVEVGHVVLVDHLLPEWGFGGLANEDSADETQLVIDTAIELDPALSYTCVVQSMANDVIYSASIGSPASSYPVGSTINFSNPLTAEDGSTHAPQQGDKWVIGPLVHAVQQFEVLSRSINQRMETTFRAVEYDEDIYDDNSFEDFGEVEQTLSQPPPVNVIPASPTKIEADEATYRDTMTGGVRPAISISWQHAEQTAHLVAETVLWIQREGWLAPIKARSVPAPDTHAILDDNRLLPGYLWTVYAQAVGQNGERRAPRMCICTQVDLTGLLPLQSEPSSLALEMVGDKAVYRVGRTGQVANDHAIEIRRGGFWMIASRIGVVGAGSPSIIGPTTNWVALGTSVAGKGHPRIAARFVGSSGALSAPRTIQPSPAVQHAGASLKQVQIEDGGWNSAGDTADLPSIPAEIERDTSYSPPRLHFHPSSSALVAEYETAIWVLDEPVRAHVSMEIDGWQQHPLAAQEWSWPAQGRRGQNWGAFEGPWDAKDPLFGQCTLEIWWKYSEDDVLSDKSYQRFTPDDVVVKRVRFKLRFTRPDEDWDVVVSRMSLNVTPLRPAAVPDYFVGGSY